VYTPKYQQEFQRALKKYKELVKRALEKTLYICNNPYQLGEPLRDNLNGLRSFPLAKNFIIVFIICEECKKLNQQKKNACVDCESIPNNTVVFLTFGPHDVAYTDAGKWRIAIASIKRFFSNNT